MSIKEFLFSNKYGSLSNRVLYFFKSKIPFISPLWNDYHNPWYHWWKVRKYFTRPKAHFMYAKNFWTFGLPIVKSYYNPILDIRFLALGWKSKYDSPRHEWDPMISITFLRTYTLLWTFNWQTKENMYSDTSSMATWEAILDYTYFNKSIDYIVEEHIWKHDSDYITIIPNMTINGIINYLKIKYENMCNK